MADDAKPKTWVDELGYEVDPTLRDYLEKFCGPGKYGEQDENGVDLSLIRENLKMTPEQRLIRGDDARRSVLWNQKHARPLQDK